MNETRKPSRPPLAWMWWLPALVWAAFIFYVSTKTSDELPSIDLPFLDKIVHFVLFGIQGAAVFAGFRFASGLRFWPSALLGCALASLYGATDEIHQFFTPGRASDLRDWIADTLGASTIFAAHFLRARGGPPT